MTTTVKEIVQNIIVNSKDEEVEVDYIEELHKNIDRVDIVNAMKALEKEKLGVVVVGRRTKKTRFKKGYIRLQTEVNQDNAKSLEEYVKTLSRGYEFPLEDKTKGKKLALDFFDGDKDQCVEALKTLEQKGLGAFVIGRRGGYSRFIVGLTKQDLTNRGKTRLVKITESSPLEIVVDNSQVQVEEPQETNLEEHPVEEGTRYNIVSGIMFKSDSGGFTSVEEALEDAGYTNYDLESIQAELDENEFCKLDEFAKAVNA